MLAENIKRDLRRFSRFAITGKIPGHLKTKGKADLVFIVVDVSRYGIGIVVDHEMAKDQELRLVIRSPKKKEISLRVIWCFPTSEEDANFRCGLEVNDKRVNLEKLFRTIPTIIMEELD